MLRRALSAHRMLVGVLVVAVLIRVAVAVAYGEALFYSDSWTYADFAYDHRVFRVAADRPIGYALALRVLALPARELWTVTIVQHLAGLAIGVLVYALLVRAGLRKVWAAVSAALCVLDAYLITLEHTVMPEALFALALTLGVFLTVGRDRGLVALCAGGLLIGGAATLRTVGVFAIPVWLVYVLWAHRDLRRLVLLGAAAAVVAPVLAYCAVHAAGTGKFGLSQTDGWFLYGRVAEIGECRDAKIPAGTRFLCERTPADAKAAREGAGPLYWIWNPQAPPWRHFRMSDPRANRLLGGFAKAIIKDRPGEYASMVAGDFARFFEPGVGSKGTSDVAIELPSRPRLTSPFYRAEVQTKYLPSYRPQVRAPSGAVRAYADVVHTPRWLLALLTLAAAGVVFGAVVLRRGARLPAHREVFLLSGMGVAMLLAGAATSEFVMRYLIPSVPLLIAGGMLAASDLVRGMRRPSGATGRAGASDDR